MATVNLECINVYLRFKNVILILKTEICNERNKGLWENLYDSIYIFFKYITNRDPNFVSPFFLV